MSSLALGEALGEHRIVERGEKDEQRAFAQPQPDEGAQFLEIRRHALRMQRVEPVAAGVVMRLAVLRADEAEHAVAESDEPELVALLLRGEAEDERRGDETLQHRRRASVPLRCSAPCARFIFNSRAVSREASTMT